MSKSEKKLFGISIAVCALLSIAIYFFGMTLTGTEHLPDTGAAWYYWKLPQATAAGRISAWSLFILHLGTVWFLLYRLRKAQEADSADVRKHNVLLLAVNLLFVLLHFVQTALWYDGLAQDVPVWSSQFSVIGMLVLILLMENGRRGLFFGKKISFVTKSAAPVFRYHGIYIAWALIYTFWFHPMENTWGHLIGFFYMFLLFVQLSMAYTKLHQTPLWTFTLEIIVMFHGTMVAILQNNGIWPMFFFGFGLIFAVTQLYGLNLSKKAIVSWTSIYVIGVVLVYSGLLFGVRSFGRIHEITWIPVIEYGLVFLLSGILNLLQPLLSKKKASNMTLSEKIKD